MCAFVVIHLLYNSPGFKPVWCIATDTYSIFFVLIFVFLFFFCFCFFFSIYLAVPGLNCGSQDLRSLVKHVESFLIESDELLVVA